MWNDFTTSLVDLLQKQTAKDLSAELPKKAVVGVSLRGNSIDDLELLFIQRSIQEQDPWSGQIGFPGGHSEAGEDDKQTLQRECAEELGVELAIERFARLDDLQARRAGVQVGLLVRPLVIGEVTENFKLQSAEVAGAFYWKLKDLIAKERQVDYEYPRAGRGTTLPAVDVGRSIPLWGMSYMIVEDLLSRLIEAKILQNFGAWRSLRSIIRNS